MIDQILPAGAGPDHWLFVSATLIIGAAIVAAVWRILRGPSLPDRVVALDMLGVLSIAMICVFAIATDREAMLIVAVVAGLILFLGTAAFAIYIERRAEP